MQTKPLQSLWWDWLGTAERLLNLLHEQGVALMTRNFPKVEKIQNELNGILTRMHQIDQNATLLAKKLAIELGGKPNLNSLLTHLGENEASQIKTMIQRIKTVGKNLKERLHTNRTLLENELNYIHGTLTLMAKTASEQQNLYGKQSQTPFLIDQTA